MRDRKRRRANRSTPPARGVHLAERRRSPSRRSAASARTTIRSSEPRWARHPLAPMPRTEVHGRRALDASRSPPVRLCTAFASSVSALGVPSPAAALSLPLARPIVSFLQAVQRFGAREGHRPRCQRLKLYGPASPWVSQTLPATTRGSAANAFDATSNLPRLRTTLERETPLHCPDVHLLRSYQCNMRCAPSEQSRNHVRMTRPGPARVDPVVVNHLFNWSSCSLALSRRRARKHKGSNLRGS
ncbi:hypothetical protein PsYK624_016330 [Phanerochaete sordida]|uniref:Uncharacterized protein n=1 Tax=Phanerochaete sordida TaxID=48140 RepID=A0A9P3L8I6_9APHY|nr:hypothetical protein PsYK624_016330 [Phanerochaete sordida]